MLYHNLNTKMKVGSAQFYLSFLLFLFSSAHSHVESFNEEKEDIKRSQFPDGFLFGTATSSYQIEGAFLEDGKSLSNWDVFNHIPGVKNVENADIANDHYHRYLEDIEIMDSLGVNAYRLSISWARVLPRGRFGEVNPTGIIFYNKIIDSLLLKGIVPFVTIHHHDFPQELEDRYGSWLSPLMQEEFVFFAQNCFKSFGDRVKYWTTINEPNLFSEMAYKKGKYPPAHCSKPFGNCSVGNSDLEPLIAMHNMLLAHAKVTKLYRERFQAKQGGFIGMVVCAFMYEPLTDNELDREAASRALAFKVAWTFDPLVFGDYPPEMRRYHGSELPRFSPEEAKYIKGSIDFIGINHYSTQYAKDCIHSSCIQGGDRAISGFAYLAMTGMPTFFVVPRGMEEIIEYVKKRYHNMPMFVTENGYSPPKQEAEQVQDQLHDVKRIEFHKAYLASLARAIRNGADVRGYFAWTLMDNYEWVEGYSLKFGFYYIDRQTLKRIPKLSARWFQNFLTNSSHSNEAGSFKGQNVIFSGLEDKKAEM
uniref:Putative beta-glucosidase 18 isoform X1 n=1 Tax=Davidia involucrata TaxID=16924 RepID=A0A5B7AKE1_DAVIN